MASTNISVDNNVFQITATNDSFEISLARTGPQGAQGPRGPAGNAPLTGNSPPAMTTGAPGDFYLDLSQNPLTLYYKLDNTTWLVVGGSGSGGDVISGTGVPLPSFGANGQLYIRLDVTPYTAYFKTSNVWAQVGGSSSGTILSGNGAPTFNIGIPGSMYVQLDSTPYIIWFKQSTSWALANTPPTLYGVSDPVDSYGNDNQFYLQQKNGIGELLWWKNPDLVTNKWQLISGGGQGVSINFIAFTAPMAGTGQIFTNTELANYTDQTDANVSVNGVIQTPVTDFTISGNNLTMVRYLNNGDSIQVAATNAGSQGGTTGVNSVSFNGGTAKFGDVMITQANADWDAITGPTQILNKPHIPVDQVQSDWTQTVTSSADFIKNKPVLATVATTGSYTDLINTPTAYALPTASSTQLGGVKVGNNLNIDQDGTLNAQNSYVLPVATSTVLGGVKQGAGTTIDSAGVISVSTNYQAPVSLTTTGSGNATFANNVLNIPNTTYTLPIATTTVLGGVKQGDYITIGNDGVITVNGLVKNSDKGVAGGVASLDSNGLIPTTQLPTLQVTNVFTAANEAARLALTAEVGDICIQTDTNTSYILRVLPASTAANWSSITAGQGVNSIAFNGGTAQTGNITFTETNPDWDSTTGPSRILNKPSIQAPITLTTTGTGAATFSSNTLNVPTPVVQSLTTTGTGSATLTSGVLNIPAPAPTLQWKTDSTTTVTPSKVVLGSNLTGSFTDPDLTLNATIPVATSTVLGGIKQGTGVTIDANGVASVSTNYQAPITLTTTGTGAATFSSNTLNVPTPVVQSLTTTGTGAATLSGGVLNIPPTATATATYIRSTFVATAGQTTFAVNYSVGYAEVFLNGSLQTSNEYTANTGVSIIFNTPLFLNDVVEVIAYSANSIATATNLAGGVANQIPYQVNIGNTSFIANGTTGQVLTANSNGPPTFQTLQTLPPQTGQSGKYLTTDGLNPSWQSVGSAAEAIGDIKFSTQAPGSNWLQCNGATYTQSAYTTLYGRLGLLGPYYNATVNNSQFLAVSNGNVNVLASNNGAYFGGGLGWYNTIGGGNFSGCIVRSTSPETANSWTVVAKFNQIYSIVGNGAGNVVLASTNYKEVKRSTDNGVTWTAITGVTNDTDTAAAIWVATNGTGTWVAISRNGWTAVSTNNGSSWTNGSSQLLDSTSGQTVSFTSIVYFNGQFITTSNYTVGTTPQADYIFTSTDGISWTQRTNPNPAPSGTGSSSNVFLCGDRVIQINTAYSAATYLPPLVSSNGTSWSVLTLPTSLAGTNWYTAGYINGYYLLSPYATGDVYVSPTTGSTLGNSSWVISPSINADNATGASPRRFLAPTVWNNNLYYIRLTGQGPTTYSVRYTSLFSYDQATQFTVPNYSKLTVPTGYDAGPINAYIRAT